MKNMTEKVDSNRGGLIAWFVGNHVAANILMMLFIVGGILSVSGMRTETFPTIDPRLITISVSFPGATPHEVATSITKRAEDALIGIEGIKKISSKASEGFGTIKIELEDFVDADNVYSDVETVINSLTNFPPENAERPVITKVRVTPNVMTLALHGGIDEESLKYWTETIEDELRQLPGVSLTSISGIRKSQISVEISEFSLRKYGLNLEDINRAIKSYSRDVPAGAIESKQREILLRVQDKKYTGFDLEKVIIKYLPNGSVITIGDIGKAIDSFEDINLISKFNGEKSAFIQIKRSESDDTLKVATIIKDYLSEVSLPKGLKMTIAVDETTVLKDRISLMLRNGILGFMLVFLILLLFLDLKLAFWTSVAIPISFLGGLMLMQQMGYSINMITLFALIVVLGIVVDDGIITGESIFEAQTNDKSETAVLDGVNAVIAPVSVGVITTMAAFAPLIFSTGTLGQIIGIIPVVVISILFISLIEAYFILPSHLSSPTLWSRGIIASIRDTASQGLKDFVEIIFTPFVKRAVKYRYITLGIFLLVVIFTAGLVKTGIVRFVFFPQIESDRITIEVNMVRGTPFSVTESTLLKIEQAVTDVRDNIDQNRKNSSFKSISLSIGATSSGSSPFKNSGSNSGNHLGEVRIQLVPSDFREYSSSQIETMIRQKVGKLTDVETLKYKSSLIGDAPDVEIELNHPDENILRHIVDELKSEIAMIKGTREIADDSQDGKSEYVFKINERGDAVGLTPDYLGRQLRSAYFGLESQRFQRGTSEIIVYVRYPKAERESLVVLDDMRIRLPNGKEVPLSSVATIKKQTGYSQIKSVNGRQIIGVTADVDIDQTTPGDVIKNLEVNIMPAIALKYPSLKYSFEGESREQSDDLSSLGRNMMIALLIIYVILGSQLRSYAQPIIIMLSIPFGVVGAILGHILLGYDLTFISLFGIVALSGVVINDSVVLVDYLNKQYLLGNSMFDSAILAVQRRFRPILLTTLSTCLGLLPIMLETSLQAQFLIPMVVSLATGIVFATMVILLLVPCLIMVLEDFKNLFRPSS
jgi:multidrug efflux pump subunit AcrB